MSASMPGAPVSGVRPIVIQNEGQRLLLEVPGTLTEIAASLGMRNADVILQWRKGIKIPGPNTATKINGVYGIPPRAWREPPMITAMDASPDATPAAGLPAGMVTRGASAGVPEPLAHCIELLGAIRAERGRPDLRPRDRVQLANVESRILALRAKLESDSELSEARFVREHPAWKRARALLLDALKEHPLAAKSVLHALERAGI
jgi:hypothetical protein